MIYSEVKSFVFKRGYKIQEALNECDMSSGNFKAMLVRKENAIKKIINAEIVVKDLLETSETNGLIPISENDESLTKLFKLLNIGLYIKAERNV